VLMRRRRRADADAPSQASEIRRAFALIRRFSGSRRVLVAAVVLLVVEALTAVVEPVPLAYLIDYLQGAAKTLRDIGFPAVMASERLETVTLLALAVVLIAAVNSASDSLAEVCMARTGRVLGYNVRVAMYSRLQRLSLGYHDRRRTGDVLTRVTGDVLVVEEFVVVSLSNLLGSVLVLLGTLALLATRSWRVALVALVVVPVLAAISNHYSLLIKAASKDQRGREGELASTAQEMLTSIRLVQSYGRSSADLARFSSQSDRSMRAAFRAATVQARFSFAIAIFEALSIAAIIYAGVWLVDRSAITVGTLVLFVLLLQNMFKPSRKIVSEWYKIGKLLASVERITDLLDREPAVVDAPDAVPAPRLRGRLAFDGVTFGYPGEGERRGVAPGEPGPTVLDRVSFDVAPGEVLALVGPSGAGKSTIAQLIPRLYDPDSGAVRVDGADLRRFTLDSLRSQVSLVLQDTVLLSGSVAENIGYGLEHPTREAIVAAARQANAHDFITELPDGYDTILGERGANLSGGQRQRIAIARAFIRQAPLLVLDEPTTGLDAESTRLVVEALRTLIAGTTTIIISHDLGLIRCADRVLVVDGGRIVQDGTYAQVTASEGPYAEIMARQVALDDAVTRTEAGIPAPRVPASGPAARAGQARHASGATRTEARPAGPDAEPPDRGRHRARRGEPAVAGQRWWGGHADESGADGHRHRAGTAGELGDALQARVPALGTALDPGASAPRVVGESGLGPDDVARIEPGSVWYRADGSVDLRYVVRPRPGSTSRRPRTVLARVGADGGGPGDVTLSAFPSDHRLPTLPAATDPARMLEVLRRSVPGLSGQRVVGGVRVGVVHHPREGACVLRYDLLPGAGGPAELRYPVVFGRVYPDDRVDEVAAEMRDARAAALLLPDGTPLRVPRPLARVPELRLLLVEAVPGRPGVPGLLRAAVRAAGSGNGAGGAGDAAALEAAVTLAAQAVATLHGGCPGGTSRGGSGAWPRRMLEDEVAAVRAEARLVEVVWPDVAARVLAALSDALEVAAGTSAARLRPAHGDWTPGQLLLDDAGPAVVDLDTLCRAEPALDLGRYLAYLQASGVRQGGEAAWPLLDHLTARIVVGYADAACLEGQDLRDLRARVRVYRSVSLARMALRSCRALKDDRTKIALELLERRGPLTRETGCLSTTR
jgi:ABC-type multidrug transport system fused ATPase/permease subunit